MSISISVEYEKYEPYKFKVAPTDTIEDLKKQIELDQGLTKEAQILCFNGTPLDDKKTIAQCKVTNGSLLDLSVKKDLINVMVKLPSGETSSDILISPLKTVWHLKREIFEKYGIATELQDLNHCGNTLHDSELLFKRDISDGTSIHLIKKQEVIMFTIKLPTGKALQRTNLPSDTIGTLKEQILKAFGYATDEQILVYGQNMLEDSKTLSHYKISNNATLHLIIEAKDALRVTLRRPNQDIVVHSLRQRTLVKELKAQIRSSDNILPENQTLKANGIVLEDENTLSFYHLTEDIIVDLIVKDLDFTVKLPDGRSLKYKNSPYLAVEDLKNTIMKDTGIHIMRQSLLFKQMLLMDSTALQNYAMQTGAIIHLAFSIIPVTLVTPLKKITIEINLYDTVFMLKRQIQDVVDMSDEKQVLIENGIILQNDSLLREYTLTIESVIYLTSIDADKVCVIIRPGVEDDIQFELPLYTSIQAIKNKLEERLNTPRENIAFLMQMPNETHRTLLENHRRLIEYDIKDECVFHLKTEHVQYKIKFVAYRDLIDVTLGPNDRIKRIKERIKEIKGVPVDSQVLRYAGEILDDSKLPENYKLVQDYVIELIIRFKVYVKTPTGDLIILITEATDTIKDLKNKINQKRNYPVENQTLIFITKTLDDDKQLNNYNIEDESTLFLIVRFDLTVQAASGEETVLKVTTFETIKKVKALIKDKLNVAVDEKNVVLNGKVLEEEKSLDFYGWKSGQVLSLE